VARKPNSVPAFAPAFRPMLRRDDDHSSSPAIADGIKRPTRKLRTGRSGSASLFGLAPCGVLPATRVATGAVRSYRTFSPLPTVALAGDGGRYIFCATFLRVAPTGRYPAHCPAEFGLSSLRLASLRLAQGQLASAEWAVTRIGPALSEPRRGESKGDHLFHCGGSAINLL
jgi:hypothetical protein